MLVAQTPSLREYLSESDTGRRPAPVSSYQDGSVAAAVLYVEEALVSCLLNDFRAALTPESVDAHNAETRLDRLKRFMDTEGGDIRQLPDDDLKNIGEFVEAVDLGDWPRAEAVIQRFHDNPIELGSLFIPVDAECERERMMAMFSEAIAPSRSMAALETRDYEILNASHYLLETELSLVSFC
jgi:hypothetical protein